MLHPRAPVKRVGRATTASRLLLVLAAGATLSCEARPATRVPAPDPTAGRPVTFNRDVAPIVFRSCAPCHRPGEAGPFSLLTYADVHKRASQVARVTSMRFMPP